MHIQRLHRWDISYGEARKLQSELVSRLIERPLRFKTPMLVGGLDCAFSADEKKVIAAMVVMRVPGYEVIEEVEARADIVFPYIPGLLTFREGPACIAAAEKLLSEPDLIIIDGQGIAHPRRMGIAAHLGIIFDRPTIGCAKSRLIGEYKEPRAKKGGYSLLYDKEAVIGAVVRTRENVKPVFVSVGNRICLEDAIKAVLYCTTRYRLPEPTRLAHQAVSRMKYSN